MTNININNMLKNVFYINLDHREDRKQNIESELNELNWGYKRFNAIKLNDGRIGCSMSHLSLLKKAKEDNLEYIVIVEDDAHFTNKTFINNIVAKVIQEKIKFDVFLLAGNIREKPLPTSHENIFKIQKCCTTTAYIVSSHYYDKLIANIEEGIKRLIKKPKEHYYYAIDVYWQYLQANDDWKMAFPRTVTQRPDYSDIEKCNTNYNYLMLDNNSDNYFLLKVE